MYMSEAAIKPRAVLEKWLVQYPAADPSGSAAAWFCQWWPKAHDLAAQLTAVPTTHFGLLENVLSQMPAGIASKKDLMLGLARGLGFMLDPERRQQYLAQLSRWGGGLDGGGHGGGALSDMHWLV